MKILYVVDRPDPFVHGIWWHRVEQPCRALEMRGHLTKQVFLGGSVSESTLDWPDVVVFGRAYPNGCTPIKWMNEFKKRGKRIVYDMDDDFWEVKKSNPSKLISSAMKDQYEGLADGADVLITPSKVLAKKFKWFFKKKVHLCPNGVDLSLYIERPHKRSKLTVGYMGANSHWKDLQIVAKVISDLSKKYDFDFYLYGLVGEHIDSAIYYYHKALQLNTLPERKEEMQAAVDMYMMLRDVGMEHRPFMPPELHPGTMSAIDIDIGLAPLEDDVFNRAKSCIKYYEYASVGTAVLTSDVLPYKDEATYRAKNTYKDWYAKLEKLITNKEFREKLAKSQQEWVKEKRSLEAIGLDWELALQRPGKKGLTVASQR